LEADCIDFRKLESSSPTRLALTAFVLLLLLQVLIKDPTKLDAIREKENSMTKDLINMILDAGANVVLTTKENASSVTFMRSFARVVDFSTTFLMCWSTFSHNVCRVSTTCRSSALWSAR